MRISKRGQVTIPKPLRDRFGMNPNVEVEIIPAACSSKSALPRNTPWIAYMESLLGSVEQETT